MRPAIAGRSTGGSTPISALDIAASKQISLEASLHELNRRLVSAQDEERRRIARELHDGMGQMIVLLKMNLDALARLGQLSSDQKELVKQSMSVVDTMLSELRTMTYLLHPPLLDELGLVLALRGLTEGFSRRSGISASLEIDDKFGRLPGDLEISIYRIVQECLTNIHRHSGSPTANIRVERHTVEIYLEVRDDGGGIPAEKLSARSGVGLGSMRERSMQLGGTLKIKSSAQGTTIIARLPLAAQPVGAMQAAGS
jgi:signal transduction histidine kinase